MKPNKLPAGLQRRNILSTWLLMLFSLAHLGMMGAASHGLPSVLAQGVSVAPGSGRLSVPIQAIKISDDDGRRPARVTAAQVQQWVNFANRVFSVANVQFQFSPASGGFTEVRSTLLNNLSSTDNSQWDAQKRAGDALAAQHRGRLVVLFRHGPGTSATGGGFSWWDYNFVVMPGWDDASHCGHPHTDALAHEIGHFLGLPHTFAGMYNSQAEAETAFRNAGGKVQVFDGDGFTDTPPDPLVRSLECARVPKLVLNGTGFTLPRANIMSYYDERNTLSPMQSVRVRWVLLTRLKQAMAMPSNIGAVAPLEAERLKIEPGASWAVSPQVMAGFGKDCWSGNQQLFFPPNPRGRVTFQLTVPATGRFQLAVYATLAPDFGRVRFLLDEEPLGAVVDAYAPIVIPSGKIALGTTRLNQGVHRLRVEMVGKNAASGNFGFGLDCVELVAVPANAP